MTWMEGLLPPKRPRDPLEDGARTRIVPLQPTDGPPHTVWLGEDLGWVPWSGHSPIAGDQVVVVGDDRQHVALTGSAPVPMHSPTFRPGGCKCKCPAESSSGLIFYLTPIWATANLLVIDGSTGALIYRSLLPDVLNGEGITVDPSPPYNLYILDNRSTYQNLITDLTPDAYLEDKNYWTLITYTLSGGVYSFSRADVLPGFGGGPHLGEGEPWNQYATALSVIDGTVWISRTTEPARFFTWDGNTFETVQLTYQGQPLADEPLGPVVMIADKPAPRTSLFVATRGNYILQFDSTGLVSAALSIDAAFQLHGLVSVCNRLVAIEGQYVGRLEDDGTGILPEGGGGEG